VLKRMRGDEEEGVEERMREAEEGKSENVRRGERGERWWWWGGRKDG
jgi:hypothetical protein